MLRCRNRAVVLARTGGLVTESFQRQSLSPVEAEEHQKQCKAVEQWVALRGEPVLRPFIKPSKAKKDAAWAFVPTNLAVCQLEVRPGPGSQDSHVFTPDTWTTTSGCPAAHCHNFKDGGLSKVLEAQLHVRRKLHMLAEEAAADAADEDGLATKAELHVMCAEVPTTTTQRSLFNQHQFLSEPLVN